MESLQQEIVQNIQNSGAIVINFDQKFTRFDIDKKNDKAGWFIGSQWTFDNKEYSAANYGNWKTGEQFKWTSWKKDLEIEDVKFRKSMVKQQQAQNQIIELQKKKENLETSERAKLEIDKLKPASTKNWYAQKKGLKFCDGLKTNIDDDLIIPMIDSPGNVVGFQRITKSGKFFLRGQKVQGAYFVIGDSQKNNLMYVAEGWATGQTIYETTGIACLVAFNCHNLGPAIDAFNQNKKYIIAADNDKAGINAAKKVARSSTNIKSIFPKFKSKTTSLTDFNDLYMTEGHDETLAQLTTIRADDFTTVELLGFQEQRFYFYSNRSKLVYDYGYTQMKDGALAEIATEEYWLSNYFEKMTKDGEPLKKCDWLKTAQKIVEIQHGIGTFSQSNIRGFGSWRDRSRIVVNTGEHLFVDNVRRPFSDRNGLKYFYYPSVKKELDFESRVENQFSPIFEALEMVDFESNAMRMYLIGFIVHACSFSAERWRTHVWLSAPHGTGKSTVMEFIQKILINSRLTQDSSAAGVRQTAKHDSLVVLADEAEGEVKTSKQLVALAKQASSGGDSAILRGSSNNGVAIEYNPSLLFCFASIRKAELTRAEASRIVDIRLKKVEGLDVKRNDERQDKLDIAADLGRELFVFVNQNLEILKNLKPQIKTVLSERGFDARSADTYANLLCGFALLANKDAAQTVDLLIDAETCEEVKENAENGDTEQFFDSLMNLMIRHNSEDMTLSQLVWGNSKDLLERYGIYIRDGYEHKGLCFVPGNQNLERVFRTQTEFKNPYSQMMQDKKRFKKQPMKVKGRSKRVFFVPLEPYDLK